jgi:hypothetical protein
LIQAASGIFLLFGNKFRQHSTLNRRIREFGVMRLAAGQETSILMP